ncbi:MAG: hypothetical protein ABL893_07580 [Hyphomicrobium sp.]
MADPTFDDAYRNVMMGLRGSDASRRRGTVRGIDPQEPSPGQEAGILEAMGVVGAPVAAVGRAIAAAPRAIGGAAGMFAGMSFGNDSQAQQRGGAVKVDPADQAAAGKLPDYLREQYLDLATRNRAGQLNRAQRQQFMDMNRLLSETASAAENAALAQKREQDGAALKLQGEQLNRAEEARIRAMAGADKPFNEQFPTWNSMQGFLPLAVGAATTLPYAIRGAAGASGAALSWRQATSQGLSATDAPALAASNNLAQSYAKQFPPPSIGSTLSPYAVPATIGAMEGAAVANLPEAYNALLPAENPERKAYAEALKMLPPGHPEYQRMKSVYDSLPQTMPARDAAFQHFGSTNFLKRMGVGALEGAGGAMFGVTAAKPFYPSEKSLPRAQTNALADRVGGRGLSEADAAIAGEAQAMGNVLPLPPARQQLPPRPLPQQAPTALPQPVQTPAYSPSNGAGPQPRNGITDFDIKALIAMGIIPPAAYAMSSDEQPQNRLMSMYYGQ